MSVKENKKLMDTIKIVAIALVVVAVFLGCFMLAGCGDSAYDIAVKNGFSGTETEWLDSLKGEDASLTIDDMYNAYLVLYPNATYEEFIADYMSVDYSPLSNAIVKGARSAVSVVCSYMYRQGNGWVSFTSNGSGTIIKLDKETGEAYIMTNYHVVYDVEYGQGTTDSMKIYPFGHENISGDTISNNSGVSVVYVGGSYSTDIAVLRASANDLLTSDIYQQAEIADDHSHRVGDTVFTVGNAAAGGLSATSGIVSVESELISISGIQSSTSTATYRTLRTDLAINGGNSGGGLFNDSGQLIAVVNAKTVDEAIEGIGNAIPVSIAMGVANRLIAESTIVYSSGVSVYGDGSYASIVDGKITVVEQIKVSTVTGVASGIVKTNDIIVSLSHNGGEKISLNRSYEFNDYMYKVESGDTLELTVIREGTTIKLNPMTISASNCTAI